MYRVESSPVGDGYRAKRKGKEMKTALFLSTACNKIDAKLRVSIPASFRQLIEEKNADLILYPSFQYPCIEGCSGDILTELAEKLDSEQSLFAPQKQSIQTLIFGSAKAFITDATGRICLSKELMAHAKLKDEAVFVGCGKTFQIWNPQLWAKEEQKRRSQIGDALHE